MMNKQRKQRKVSQKQDELLNERSHDTDDDLEHIQANLPTQEINEESKKQKIPKKRKVKQTTQPQSSEKRQLNEQVVTILKNQFVVNNIMTLTYQNQDLMMYMIEAKDKGTDFVDKILLEWFQSKYCDMCYRQSFIYQIQQISERSSINCLVIRNGQLTYEINCRVFMKTIQIEPFSVINCQITEINQSHNSGVILLINKGTSESNLQVANVFIQLENNSQESQQIYNQHLQIGQFIPCVVQKSTYQTGLQHVTIFGSLLKKLNFKHVYVFKKHHIDPKSFEQSLNTIGILAKEIEEEGLLKTKQFIEILRNVQISDKQLKDQLQEALGITEIAQSFSEFKQNRVQSQQKSKSFKSRSASEQSINFKDDILIELDLVGYIYGKGLQIKEGTLSNYQQDQIVVDMIMDDDQKSLIQQLLNRIQKWQLFFIEFMTQNSSSKSFKNIQQLLSI